MPKLLLKRTSYIVLIFALILGSFLINVSETNAQEGGMAAPKLMRAVLEMFPGLGITVKAALTIGKAITESFAGQMLEGMAYLIWVGTSWFLAVCANLFSNALDFTAQQLSQSPVYTGWTISRDIVNMFFILGLIVIAFATILRTETYGMKALLPKIIIMALLINFSYLVCGIIIDTSQIPADFFIQRIKATDEPTNRLGIGGLMMAAMTDLGGLRGTKGVPGTTEALDFYSRIIAQLAQALAMAIAAFILLIGAVLLVIRMAGLWVLIILSPFAWFLGIFPKFKPLANKWWSNFLKYAFFAPIFVFFIFLGLNLVDQINAHALNLDAPQRFLESIAILTHYLIAIVVFGGAPMVAMSMGIYGASTVIGTAKGALKGTYKLPGRLRKAMVAPPGWLKAASPKFAAGLSKVAAFTSPELWKQAIEERRRERMREARIGMVLGKQQDLLNRVLSIGQKKTTHAERAEQFEVEERKKEMTLDTKGVESALFKKFEDAHKRKDIVDMKSAVELLLEDKNHNDLMLFTNMFDKMSYSDSELVDEKIRGKRVNPLGDAATEEERREGRVYSDPGFKDLMYQMFSQAGASESGTSAFMGRLGEMGIRIGAYPLYHGGKMDAEGNWVRTDDKEQAEISAAKYESLTLRDKGRNEHGTTYGTQKWDWKNNRYEFKNLSDSSRKIFKKISIGDIDKKRFYEMRDDSFRALGMAVKQLTKELRNPKLVEEHYKDWAPEDNAKMKFYEKRIDEYVTLKKKEEEGEEGEKKEKKKTKKSEK